MQIGIVKGIYSDSNADFRTYYPVNMIPVPKDQAMSKGYLRPSEGIISINDSTGGIDRGGVNWRGKHYRVIGQSLYLIQKNNTFVNLGTIKGDDQVTFDYSFDQLGICANNQLFYYNEAVLTQVTDEDLGDCKSMVFLDGYFVSTDGEFIIVTELNDPTSVDTFKYGSSEVDPDPVVALHKIKGELYAINRNTIEVFTNVGGTGFPFRPIPTAQVSKGAISRNLTAVFEDTLVFLGGGAKDEALSLYIAINGTHTKISTREIDQLINGYDEEDLIIDASIEVRIFDSHLFVYLHLKDVTCVYDINASRQMQTPVWHRLSSGTSGISQYNARNFVYVYNKWYCGHTTENKIGYLSNTIQSQWGNQISWEFQVAVIYNEGRGAIVHELELIPLSGTVSIGKDPQMYTQYSKDLANFSMPSFIKTGKFGERSKRLCWRNQGKLDRYRVQRFGGNSDSHISFARLDAKIEGLAW